MRELSRCQVTVSLILLGIAVYAVWGPARGAGSVTSLADHLIGVFRHGNAGHLALNCLLIGIGGALTEPRIGPAGTALLAALCAILGTVAELTLAGPGFVGLSAIAYGLAAHGILASTPPDRRGYTVVLIALALTAEALFLRPQIAVFTHITAAAIGGGFAMFGSLFGTKGPSLKPMEWRHTTRVIEIIGQTDEDDAVEAEGTFLDDGMDNMFVLQDRGEVLGVIGFGLDEQVPDLAWLSWTYLDEAQTGKGLGGQMLNDLLGKLAKKGIRKIFIETSDYEEFGKKIYASAHELYEEFGASVELTVPAYHGPREAKIIYGLDNPEAPATPAPEPGQSTGLAITELHKAAETLDVAGLHWTETPGGLTGMEQQLTQARTQKFRMAVLAIPSDLSAANSATLETQGFRRCGDLKDYYGTGLHQDWWTCDLTQK
ncbi:GNAT family N-acetyltransferase [Ruegeria sp. HKCCD8929]|uniref:GNAT family N-acetyltransferase n=1 Tax=Ruegeria sp. HKCCD8929 TaxID=2683006 RepID=UPI001488A744|nr:GNAT family N-acetyltransferase [Ruegeria sp. HKCCD8929]